MDLLEACKMAYKKHVLNDDSIGWDELGDCLLSAICNEIGDDGYQAWLNIEKNPKMKQLKMFYCPKCKRQQNIPTLEQSGPHTKALCYYCGAYIKFSQKKEIENIEYALAGDYEKIS